MQKISKQVSVRKLKKKLLKIKQCIYTYKNQQIIVTNKVKT